MTGRFIFIEICLFLPNVNNFDPFDFNESERVHPSVLMIA